MKVKEAFAMRYFLALTLLFTTPAFAQVNPSRDYDNSAPLPTTGVYRDEKGELREKRDIQPDEPEGASRPAGSIQPQAVERQQEVNRNQGNSPVGRARGNNTPGARSY